MIVIGRKDRIDLPQLGLLDIDAKIDTGAYGCALHCHHIAIVKRNEKDILCFKVLDPNHPEYKGKLFYAEDFSCKTVKNSGGKEEHRYVIKTQLVIFNKEKKVEFSLTNRKRMKCPILLGRKFLSKQFIVDVQKKDLSFQLKNKQQ